MSLTADPSVTFNAAGNILAVSTALAASGVNSGSVVDFSVNSLGGWIQITDIGGGSVSATSGLQVQVFPAGDSTPHYDSVAIYTFTITTVASTTSRQSILLPTGKYSITLTNLDATNGITVGITSNPVA
jgi:hypothetical protein